MLPSNKNAIKKEDTYSPIYTRKLYKAREAGRRKMSYAIDWGDFSARSVEVRSRGPGWKRAEDVKRDLRTPRLLYREEARRIEARKKELGPGTYDIPDPISELLRKPSSKSGSMDAKFKRERFSDVPGPGTYGKGGIPSKQLEESYIRSPGNKGMLQYPYRPDPLAGGSGLAPNRYDTNDSGIQQILDKVVSLKGPYETFTTDRTVYNVGYLAKGKSPYIGSEVGLAVNGLDKWDDDDHKHHGKFNRSEQRPLHPTERMFLVDPVLAYKPASFPAPGKYHTELPKWKSFNRKPVPFMSTSSRNDRRSMNFFMPNQNSCAVGRYRPERYQPKQINGCCSAFKSKTRRPTFKEFVHKNERTRARNVPADRREHLLKPLVKEDILKRVSTLLPCQTGLPPQ